MKLVFVKFLCYTAHMDRTQSSTKKVSLAVQIFIALILAVIVGLLMQKIPDVANSYIKPFGTIFLNLVKFIVGPIVLFSIMAGIVSMRDLKKLGAIGGTTLVYYFITTAIAVSIVRGRSLDMCIHHVIGSV